MNPLVVTAGAAFAVVQAAKMLPSPFKEIMLTLVCAGVLIGHSIMQEADRKRNAGPPPPRGWKWRHRSSDQDSEEARPERATDTATHAVDSNAGAAPSAGEATGSAKEPKEEAEGLPCELPGPEVLVYPAEDAGPSLGIAIVPGNPGIPHFYCSFGHRLQEEVLAAGCGPCTVYVVGYPNFVTGADAATARERQGVASIDEEAVAIGATLSKLRAEHQARGLVLVGHSIGSWIIAQHLLEEAEGDCKDKAEGASGGSKQEDEKKSASQGAPFENVPLVIMAMPYLEFDLGGQGLLRVLLSLPFIESLLRFVALTALMLPERFLASLLRLFQPSCSQEPERGILMGTFLRQPHHLVGMPIMGRTEFVRLDPALTTSAGFEELRPLIKAPGRPPIVAIYTPKDSWGPAHHRERFAKMLAVSGTDGDEGSKTNVSAPAEEVAARDEVLDLSTVGVLPDDMQPPRHDFVTSARQSDAVATVVASRVVAHVTRGCAAGSRT
eukprot:TRINITY_DN26728_c0_g1_i1.p1 TRINITY_DN26728_c0_g1~~TRINITY_DN26728_c0_g1_i1.p1  ORF type:complete len:496 (-),score=100.60 TRINITY_DN26728_c0_g1_i1:65-1552(-)